MTSKEMEVRSGVPRANIRYYEAQGLLTPERAKNGYRQNSAASDYIKSGLIAALILYYCYLLSQYRGISVMLVWVVAICLIYNFITAKTAFGRYFYAVGGNEKAPSSPASTPIRSTLSPTPTWACWPACGSCLHRGGADPGPGAGVPPLPGGRAGGGLSPGPGPSMCFPMWSGI